MNEYKRFDETAWGGVGKALLKDKGSEKQVKFLNACKLGKDSFLEYIKTSLPDSNIIAGRLVNFTYKFTENEFICPPRNTQEEIWNAFRDISDEVAYKCGFWGHIILRMIEDGNIQPDYLASKLNGINDTGSYIIDKALKSDDKREIDDCVRRVLRSMCNPEPRGKRIVFNDFYLGKAYWHWYWADKMSKLIDIKRDGILKILNEKYYAAFSEKMHSGKSYIGSENILGGLLLFLRQQAQSQQAQITDKELIKIIDLIAYLSVWKALEAQEPESNQKEIRKIADTVNLLS